MILALVATGCFYKGAGDPDTATWWASSYETCSRLADLYYEYENPCGDEGCVIVRCVDDVDGDGADCMSGHAFAYAGDAAIRALEDECGESWVEYPYAERCGSEEGTQLWDLSISCVP